MPFTDLDSTLKHNDYLLYKLNFLRLSNPKVKIDEFMVEEALESHIEGFKGITSTDPGKVDDEFMSRMNGLINQIYGDTPQNVQVLLKEDKKKSKGDIADEDEAEIDKYVLKADRESFEAKMDTHKPKNAQKYFSIL
jgi:hypothetical protein